MKKIFLENLPMIDGIGLNYGKQTINWIKNAELKCRVKFIYDDIEGEIEIVDYQSKDQILSIKYLDKDIFKIKTSNFKNCNISRLLDKRTNEFKIKIGTNYKDDKRDITIIDRKIEIENYEYQKYNKKYYKYRCNKCGFNGGEHYKNGEHKEEHWVLEGDLIKKGCSCCHGRITIPHINSIVANLETHWMIKYFQGGYEEAKMFTPQSSQRIKPICLDCGRIKDKEISINSIYNEKSIGCPCGDGFSYPEKIVFNLLEQLNIEFTYQFKPNWIKPKKYDFYFKLNNKKYIIETDGALGHGKKVYSKSNKTKEETKADDDYKEKQAIFHNVEMIRIDCEKSNIEYIKGNILNSELSNIFDLTYIDWLKCEEFALKNKVKEICQLKRKNPEMTTGDMSKNFNLASTTILSYLKKGTKLGWCNYDPILEKSKVSSKSGKMNGKQVEILKDGISLGIFESVAELSRKSQELFGVKLIVSCMSLVCQGKQKYHKNYNFRYIL